jgi:hypothetical protein
MFKSKVDPGFIMSLYTLLDVMFRKGPRGGTTFMELLDSVEQIYKVAEELKTDLMNDKDSTSSTSSRYILKESEVKMLETASERALKTLNGLKEMKDKMSASNSR